MITEGPLKIGVIDRNNGSRELHLDFTDDFRRMKLSQQCEAFHEFILYLKCEIGVLEEHDPSHQGMLTILQTSEQLLPQIEAGEIALADTIVIKLDTSGPSGNFTFLD